MSLPVMNATFIRTKTEPSRWDELKRERVLLSIPEFCSVLGWHRSKYYRHKDSIRVVEGYGNPMIPIGEVGRILGEPNEPTDDKEIETLEIKADFEYVLKELKALGPDATFGDLVEAKEAQRKEAGK